MDQQLQQRFDEMQDHITALQQLLLAQTLALDAIDRQATCTVLDILHGQSDGALNQGRNRQAIRLDGLACAIREGLADAGSEGRNAPPTQ